MIWNWCSWYCFELKISFSGNLTLKNSIETTKNGTKDKESSIGMDRHIKRCQQLIIKNGCKCFGQRGKEKVALGPCFSFVLHIESSKRPALCLPFTASNSCKSVSHSSGVCQWNKWACCWNAVASFARRGQNATPINPPNMSNSFWVDCSSWPNPQSIFSCMFMFAIISSKMWPFTANGSRLTKRIAHHSINENENNTPLARFHVHLLANWIFMLLCGEINDNRKLSGMFSIARLQFHVNASALLLNTTFPRFTKPYKCQARYSRSQLLHSISPLPNNSPYIIRRATSHPTYFRLCKLRIFVAFSEKFTLYIQPIVACVNATPYNRTRKATWKKVDGSPHTLTEMPYKLYRTKTGLYVQSDWDNN